MTASAHNQTGTYEGVSVRELLTRAGVPAGEALRGASRLPGCAPFQLIMTGEKRRRAGSRQVVSIGVVASAR